MHNNWSEKCEAAHLVNTVNKNPGRDFDTQVVPGVKMHSHKSKCLLLLHAVSMPSGDCYRRCVAAVKERTGLADITLSKSHKGLSE